ncbi:MAG: enoyl-CoA hydratase-related protein [Jatrophihabitans sp.]
MSDAELEVTSANGVTQLTVNRAKTLNSLTAALLEDAAAAVRAAGADPAVRVVVLTGVGRAFSSGAELGAIPDHPRGRIATLEAGNDLVEAITVCPKPVVAVVNGLAVGIGATIALACDLVVARRSSYFLLAFVNIGLMPDGGATALVPAAIGRARAARMAMLGERIPADTALEWGLISHVVDDAEFETEVAAIIDELAHSATAAIAATKAALADATLTSLRQAHATEREGQLELFQTHDHVEGVAAFQQKRPAQFRGH